MKYDARACHFNMDTGCVELLLRDGRKISIDCTGVEDALDVTMAQRSELDFSFCSNARSFDRPTVAKPGEKIKVPISCQAQGRGCFPPCTCGWWLVDGLQVPVVMRFFSSFSISSNCAIYALCCLRIFVVSTFT